MLKGKTILIMHVAGDLPPTFVHHSAKSDIGTVIMVNEKKDPFENEPIKIIRPYHDFALPEIECYDGGPIAQKKSRNGGNNRKGHSRKKKHKRKLRFK